MSLRSKLVGALLGVFLLYVLAAWLVLALIHTPAFHSLERSNALNQLNRVYEFIEAEGADVDLLVTDWAAWDDAMYFVQGEYDEFYDENLTGSYLAELGMSFGAILDMEDQVVWAQSYSDDGAATSLDYLFPTGIPTDSALLRPAKVDEHVTGLIETAQGPAIVSSAAIVWSSGEGPPGGHFIAGKLLDNARLDFLSKLFLSKIELLPVDSDSLPMEFRPALSELIANEDSPTSISQGDIISSLKLLRDIEGEKFRLLSTSSQADITLLGENALRNTILMLILAALIVTLTLWLVLKGMLLLPIEHLTTVLRGEGKNSSSEEGENLLSTIARLTDSRGSISQRSDEIGELISAFDDLSSSLREATTSVWRIAHFDGLTGLANRRMMLERLSDCIETAPENQKLVALFIDLDDFKIVNDQLGHDAGDQLLVEAAARIRSVVGVDDALESANDEAANLVARIGGDEFVVILTTGNLPTAANDVAASIVEAVASPYFIKDDECHIGACVGMAVFPDDAINVEEVLANADAAMYEAKRAGKNTWRRYDSSRSQQTLRKIA